MFNPKRLWMVLSSALTLGVVGVLVLAGTAPGASALRAVANNLAVAASAAGGGGGGGGMSITVASTGSLTAKLAVTTSVSYTCMPINGDTLLATNLFVQISEKVSGKLVAQGSGSFNGAGLCDGSTVNTATVVVIPDGFFTNPPFKHGTGLATVSGSACSDVITSGGFPQCEGGSAGPTAVSIK
jgi:hypothetical protein